MSEGADGKAGGEGRERKRPNANYRLSKANEAARPEDIVYHYSRERRLEKAPASVQDLYYGGDPPRRSAFFRAGPGGKMHLFTMIAILLICALALAATLVGRDGDAHELDGNRVAVQAIRYGGMVIMAVDKTARAPRRFLSLRAPRPAYVGPVGVEVSPAGLPPFGGPFLHMLSFTETSPEFFRFTIPFDADEVELVLRTEGRELRVTVAVE